MRAWLALGGGSRMHLSSAPGWPDGDSHHTRKRLSRCLSFHQTPRPKRRCQTGHPARSHRGLRTSTVGGGTHPAISSGQLLLPPPPFLSSLRTGPLSLSQSCLLRLSVVWHRGSCGLAVSLPWPLSPEGSLSLASLRLL